MWTYMKTLTDPKSCDHLSWNKHVPITKMKSASQKKHRLNKLRRENSFRLNHIVIKICQQYHLSDINLDERTDIVLKWEICWPQFSLKIIGTFSVVFLWNFRLSSFNEDITGLGRLLFHCWSWWMSICHHHKYQGNQRGLILIDTSYFRRVTVF